MKSITLPICPNCGQIMDEMRVYIAKQTDMVRHYSRGAGEKTYTLTDEVAGESSYDDPIMVACGYCGRELPENETKELMEIIESDDLTLL